MPMGLMVLLSAAVVATAVVYARNAKTNPRREQYIRSYMFPRGLFEKLLQRRPGLDVKQQQLVARALRQFFLAYLKGGRRRVGMPSQVVDDLWHEFILYTRDYAEFCANAFGTFLHHTPAVRLGTQRADNEGLRRLWWYACLEENINPRKPTRLPLLFALDAKLGITDGFIYQLDCGRAPADVRKADYAGTYCATHFNDFGVDGSVDGFGESGGGSGHSRHAHDQDGAHHAGSSPDAHDGPGGGDSGCSGGCGGD
jgi:hypothetical protein